MSVAIGIDLGTTNTVVAVVKDGLAQTIESPDGGRLIPSIVSFHPSGSVLVGAAARERRLIDPENTVYSVKRLIGRPWSSEEVQQARGRFPFKLVEGPKNTTMCVARDVAYALPEISAFVLRRAKAIAEEALGEAVDRAVVTVPANFNDLQRASTKIAGKLAGLDVLRILNEPTAAALAYGQSIAQAEKIAIYDLGGGTFDITLLDLSGSVFEVLSTAGDTALGGDDMDVLIADQMAEHIMRTHRYDPRTNPVAFGRLRWLGEMVKQQLSTQTEASIEISDIGYGEGGMPLQLTYRMTREQLEAAVRELVERTVEVSRFSIETIGMKIEQFDRVILVGGATRMPMVQRRVQEFFKRPPHIRINPDEVVALGAAIQAFSLNRAKAKAHKSRPAPAAASLAQAQATTGVPPARVEAPDLPLVNAAPAAPPPAKGAPPQPAPAQPPQLGRSPGPLGPTELTKSAPTITFSPPPAANAQAPKIPPARAPAAAPIAAPVAAPVAAPAAAVASAPDMPSLPSEPRKPQKTMPFAVLEPPPKQSSAKQPAPPPTPELELELDVEPDPSGPPIELGAIPSNRANAAAASHAGPSAEQRPAPQPTPRAAPKGAIPTRADAPLLIDVTPLSLRVETVAGYSDALITANTPVPCDRTKVFLTASDNQTQVFIRVAQGESNKFADNAYLGELELSGLQPASRGDVRIAVTFELDADGILNVRAKDERTGRETKATMRLLGANTDAKDVEMMMERQRRHAVH
jgi:molecular chaperone DnaK